MAEGFHPVKCNPKRSHLETCLGSGAAVIFWLRLLTQPSKIQGFNAEIDIFKAFQSNG